MNAPRLDTNRKTNIEWLGDNWMHLVWAGALGVSFYVSNHPRLREIYRKLREYLKERGNPAALALCDKLQENQGQAM